MKLIVWKIVGTKTINFGKNKGAEYIRVAFKSLDEIDKTSYYLNLPYNYGHFSDWMKNIEEGNVLDVSLQPNNKNINYFTNYNLVKKVSNA